MEAIRIARDGFPTRYAYRSFFNRFSLLSDRDLPECRNDDDFKLAVKNLLPELVKIALAANTHQKLENYQLGKTKLFLKGGQLALLEELRTAKRTKSAIMLQKVIRGIKAQAEFFKNKSALIAIQAFYRMLKSKKKAEIIQRVKASTILQSYIRLWKARSEYLVVRGRERATQVLQKYVRSWKEQTAFNIFRYKVVLIQARWRSKAAKQQYHKMKEEARKVANLAAENRKMLERTQQLETEKINVTKKIDEEKTVKHEAERKALKAKVETYENELDGKNELIEQLRANELKMEKKLLSEREENKLSEKKSMS